MNDPTRLYEKSLRIVAADNLTKFDDCLNSGLVRLDEADYSDRTLLHWAAQDEADDIAEKIISIAPHLIDWEDEHGQTALRMASGEGHFITAKVLLFYGASIRCSCDSRDRTVLELAKRFGHEDVVLLLEIAEKNPLLLRRAKA